MDNRKLKICLISDLDFRSSGYFNISIALGNGLTERGHDVKALGISYRGEEHTFPLSILPCMNVQETLGMAQNLSFLWGFDIVLVVMDIPYQEGYLQSIQQRGDIKYVGIMPVEADPLCMTWAIDLMQMDKALIISEFGTEEAKKAGVDATYIPIGIDSNSWRMPTEEERNSLRKALGYDEDDFVVLTVAYNQERKFLSRGMEMFADFVYDQDNVETLFSTNKDLSPVRKAKYVMVTAEQSPVGWRLRDLAKELGISDRFFVYERGMPHNKLWGLYAASDAFLLPSKAEGLGMILMESMATGVPSIGTNCTGIKELLSDGRGYLIPFDYTIRDPFGNGRRYYPSRKDGKNILTYIMENGKDAEMIAKARAFVESRSWEKSVDVLENVLLSIVEKKDEQTEEKQNYIAS